MEKGPENAFEEIPNRLYRINGRGIRNARQEFACFIFTAFSSGAPTTSFIMVYQPL